MSVLTNTGQIPEGLLGSMDFRDKTRMGFVMLGERSNASYYGRCSCGWTSLVMKNEELAEGMFYEHARTHGWPEERL